MAQSTLHLSFGMLLGTLFSLPSLWRGWRHNLPMARTVTHWCLLSFALGFYAVIPAIVRRLGSNPDIGSSAGWNLFLFYPMLDQLPAPSIVGGELTVSVVFALQYLAILLAIYRAQRRVAVHKSEN